MTNGQIDSASSSLADVQQRLKGAAIALGFKVEDDDDLINPVFSGGGSISTSLSVSDLPTAKRGLRIGRYAIILGILPEAPQLEMVRETLRRYRNQCVVARSYLNKNEALDLQLVLLGPEGSERQMEWRALALMVERDDRVARKLAWLLPRDPSNYEKSFTEFLKRTFLARPWSSRAKFEAAALDRLSSLEVGGAGVPRSTVEEWEQIALSGEEDSDKVVDALIEAWRRKDVR